MTSSSGDLPVAVNQVIVWDPLPSTSLALELDFRGVNMKLGFEGQRVKGGPWSPITLQNKNRRDRTVAAVSDRYISKDDSFDGFVSFRLRTTGSGGGGRYSAVWGGDDGDDGDDSDGNDDDKDDDMNLLSSKLLPDFRIECGLGRVRTYQPVTFCAKGTITKKGMRSLLGAPFGTYAKLPSTAVSLTLVSTSNEDVCRIGLFGVGDGFEAQTEELVLSGTTPVFTSLEWLRVNNMRILESESENAARGTIRATFVKNGTLTTLATIEPHEHQSFLPVYSCPKGFSLLLMSTHASFSSFDQLDKIVIERVATQASEPPCTLAQVFASLTPYCRNFPFGKLVKEGQDVLISGTRVSNIVTMTLEVEALLAANQSF